jgi:hypothetical protein
MLTAPWGITLPFDFISWTRVWIFERPATRPFIGARPVFSPGKPRVFPVTARNALVVDRSGERMLLHAQLSTAKSGLDGNAHIEN